MAPGDGEMVQRSQALSDPIDTAARDLRNQPAHAVFRSCRDLPVVPPASGPVPGVDRQADMACRLPVPASCRRTRGSPP